MKEKKILIVDDEPRTREGLKRTLDKYSEGQFNIMTLGNAHDAIDFLQQQTVHLLITDIRMPKMTGLSLLNVLKEQEIEPMVIVISAYSEFSYAQEALQLGVTDYLLKPIGKQKLVESVEAALEKQEEQNKSKFMAKMVDDDLININAESSYSRSIKEAVHYIDEYYDEELTLKEVAHHVHLNPSYLSTLFKEEIQLSFTEYLTRVRLQHAKQLLLTTDKNVTEIAETVGYNTPKYFNKVFKEQENMTPSAYRKANENAL
ncbi:two component transcriptional regulator, AraC family [Pelagirhabdus alkalitolerans]|uniref:Two component transcriptional regulator, AraC family n=1 Tax=Pelagirhabdus alkalitolerans TaxID=1612202 RepID=A0A1G6L3J2_9BACI|nr:response regulator [Pelagirhabdus alkalitolerans]SDC37757.1 two component transcriptional regulator, AraC family [Pelagirhabdus alkalitolerans]